MQSYNVLAPSHIYSVLYYHTGKNMTYLYHSFHVLRLLLNISWLIVRKEIEQKKDGINLTEKYFLKVRMSINLVVTS